MKINLSDDWNSMLRNEIEQPYFQQLAEFVENEYATEKVFPEYENIFRAFELCHPNDIKVVIIGQDPYHGDNQANGLCFSVNDWVQFPPSLVNIFKEIKSDIGIDVPNSGNLDRWARQGVLLLNSVLTVRAHSAASHANKGWERFTDAVVEAVSKRNRNVVYMLWGAYAQKKGQIVDEVENCILKSVHPSPLSSYRGFFGCKHFSKANKYLESSGKSPIIW